MKSHKEYFTPPDKKGNRLHDTHPLLCGLPAGQALTDETLHIAWRQTRSLLRARLSEFATLLKNGSEECLFAELAFCLLTPQSKARNCWKAVMGLFRNGLLLHGTPGCIAKELSGVRFHHTKAARIVMARRQFSAEGTLDIRKRIKELGTPYKAREWLAATITGLGFKEASHFLRNIGFGDTLCILDRHIMRNLKTLGVINEIPAALPRAKYLAIEEKMNDFARRLKIPPDELDLLLWCRQTGEIFK